MERRRQLLILLLVCLAAPAWPQAAEKKSDEKPPQQEAAPPSETPQNESAKPIPEVEDSSSGASKRNENVYINRIDTGFIKELNVRLGDNVTIADQPSIDRRNYASEHGRTETDVLYFKPSLIDRWHGSAFEDHRNSVFNARSFFQVGPVQPSHQNFYGGDVGGPVSHDTEIGVQFQQHKIRGMVNGNVLVPLPSERTPLATDPKLRAIVQRFLDAYPKELPNRTDFDPRALNTNSPQTINETGGTVWLDHRFTDRDHLAFSYAADHQFVNAFELVAGQNPDTDVGSQTGKLSLLHETPLGTWDSGFEFQRTRSLLVPEPNAVGANVRMGHNLEELGPTPEFPIDRAQNMFRAGTEVSKIHGAHHLVYGAEFFRWQLNGIETRNQRPVITFGSNSSGDLITNLRLGLPLQYEVSLGELSRGFRNSNWQFFFGDTWKATANLQLNLGLRYGIETAPHEVQNRVAIDYHCSCHEMGPLIGLAYKLPDDSVIRANYTLSYGQIYPVTYQQARFNPPSVIDYIVQNPNLVDPLANVTPGRTSLVLLDPHLVAPYANQYNFSWERTLFGKSHLKLGYIGSHTVKIPYQIVTNRAQPSLTATTDNVNDRRPDPRYYEVGRVINNGIAYLDAAQVVYDLPRARGLSLRITYTFGKAIDTGADYAFTAANADASRGRSQFEDDIWHDKKGLSDFDGTNYFLAQYAYQFPSPAAPLRRFLGGWELSGATLVKTGTPSTLYIGSDAPGFGNVDGSPSERPNILDPSILGMTINNPDTAPLILTRDKFSYITLGQKRGNLGRGTFRKDGIRNFNLALERLFHLPGNHDRTLGFRAEAFNAFNHPQFDEAQRNLTSPAFGKITNTLNDGRIFQLGFRFSF
ncbi:MAG TPA: hypothetical protein VEU62_21885 [Bryobacterales bacterium]|nr:hypothetical protein [Bryobacterales bacterium]